MAYSKALLVDDIRDFLGDEPWETTSTTTTTSTTVAVPDGTKWAAGDVGEWTYSGTVGGELFLVSSVSSNNLTVVRGYGGTTAETHSSGDRVLKNPAYYNIHIVEAIDRVIESMYPTVWTSATTTITPNTTATWFDSGLTGTKLSGLIDIIKGEQLYGSSSQYVGTYGSVSPYIPSRSIQFERNLPTALVASGVGVKFDWGFHHASNTITVYWRVKLTPTVVGGNYSDLSSGILSEMVALGAVARLLRAKQVLNVSEQRGGKDILQMADYMRERYLERLHQRHMFLMNSIPPLPDQRYLPGSW